MFARIGLIVVALVLIGLLLLGIGAGAGILRVSSDGISIAKKDDSAAASDVKPNVVSADDLLKREGVKYVEPTPAPKPITATPPASTAPKPAIAIVPPQPIAPPPPTVVTKEKPASNAPARPAIPDARVAEKPIEPQIRENLGEHGKRGERDDRVADRGQDARLAALRGKEDPNIIRVAAGSSKPLIDPAGHVWEPGAASGFDDGATSDKGEIEIRNSRFPALCRYERWGTTGWRRRMPNGHYTVLLHFAETFDAVTGPNQRTFGIDVQGQRIDNLDIFKEAGGLRREIIKNFHVEVVDKKLTIKFIPTDKRAPTINGIEVIPDGPVGNLVIRRDDARNKDEAPTAIRVAAGSAVPVRDAHGDIWEPDSGFDKGIIVDRGPIAIDKTDIPDIYRTEHYGMSAWNRKIPNGNYIVNLHFAETSDSVSAPGQRIFHVVVQDKPIKNLDVYHESGGVRHALIKSFPIKVANRKLTILFATTGKNVPEINGIEVIPTDDAAAKGRAQAGNRDTVAAIRIAAGSSAELHDPRGNAWNPDSNFDGGQTVDRGPIIIENTDFPSLYRSEHYGMTAWRKPVPNGKYAVTLHFCETWDLVTAAAPRVFGVTVQGQPLRDLDIFKETGGLRRPLIKTFHIAVTGGQLEILFERTNMNVPEINGIEIAPER